MSSTDGPDRADPHGFHFVWRGEEDARVHTMRQAQTILLRQTIRRWIDDQTVSDEDFAFWLHRYTYEDSRVLLDYALKIIDGKI